MQSSITQLIFIALAVTVAAIVSVVIFSVIRDEGDNIDQNRNQAAFLACDQAGGTFTIGPAGSVTTINDVTDAGIADSVDRLGECSFNN